MTTFQEYKPEAPQIVPVFPREIFTVLTRETLHIAYDAVRRTLDQMPGVSREKRKVLYGGFTEPFEVNFEVTARCHDPTAPASERVEASKALLKLVEHGKIEGADLETIKTLAHDTLHTHALNTSASLSYYGQTRGDQLIGDLRADMQSGITEEAATSKDGRYLRYISEHFAEPGPGLIYNNPEYTERLTRVATRVIEVFRNAEPEHIEVTYARDLIGSPR